MGFASGAAWARAWSAEGTYHASLSVSFRIWGDPMLRPKQKDSYWHGERPTQKGHPSIFSKNETAETLDMSYKALHM